MIPINYKKINKRNIIIKTNNDLYYSTDCVTLNSLNIEFQIKNIKINNEKCNYNYNENKNVFIAIENIEKHILNYKKQCFYNLKNIFKKNFFYINNYEIIRTNNKIYKTMNFILILNKIQKSNNNFYLKVNFIIHPLNNN